MIGDTTTVLESRIAELQERIKQLELENETLVKLCNDGQETIDNLTDQNAMLVDELGARERDHDVPAEEYLSGTFVGTPSRKHFHRPDCKWIQGMFVIQFPSHEAAVRAGRKPCKTCRA